MMRCLIAGLCLALVAGCSGGGEGAQLSSGQLTSLLSQVWQSRAKPQAPITVTRALVDATPGAVMQARSESLNQTAFLSRIASRGDGLPGVITVWQSGDAAQLVFRDGVLVATRGLGDDMLSSEASMAIKGLRDRRARRLSRAMEFRTGEGGLVRLRVDCRLTDLGSVEVQIVDRLIPVRHMRESCLGQGDGFTNDYWIGDSDDLIWRSRQWAGPTLGYFDLTLLKN